MPCSSSAACCCSSFRWRLRSQRRAPSPSPPAPPAPTLRRRNRSRVRWPKPSGIAHTCTSSSYLIDRGLSAEIGGWTLATIGLFNIIGSTSVGWLANYYPRRYLLALNYFLRAVFIAAFVLLPASPV